MSRLNHMHLPDDHLTVNLRTDHGSVPEYVREHARDRLARSSRFGVVIDTVDVVFAMERNPRRSADSHRVEITGRSPGVVVRAEASGQDWLTAFDACLDRWHERLRRTGERRTARRHGRFGHARALQQGVGALVAPAAAPAGPAATAVAEEDVRLRVIGSFTVREKVHHSPRMSVADAIDAMEMVGHEFFAFVDDETGQFSVVYQRRAFTYGLIRIEEH